MIPRLVSASTIAPPPLNSMVTTPGTVFVDLNLMICFKQMHILTVVGEMSQLVLFYIPAAICQSHISMSVVMTIAFSISGNMDQLMLYPAIKTPYQ
jgi:hypothetical protein